LWNNQPIPSVDEFAMQSEFSFVSFSSNPHQTAIAQALARHEDTAIAR
jgi:hypothetical protein